MTSWRPVDDSSMREDDHDPVIEYIANAGSYLGWSLRAMEGFQVRCTAGHPIHQPWGITSPLNLSW